MKNRAEPPRSEPRARRAAWVLFGMLAFTYGYFYWVGNANENSRFDLTRALVEDHALHINRFPNSHDVLIVKRAPARLARHPGPPVYVYSNKAPGSSFWAAPFWAAFYYALAALPPGDRLTLAHYLTKWAALGLACAGGAALMLAWLWRVSGRPLASVIVALGLGLASPLFPYAVIYYSAALTAVALFLAFYLVWEAKSRDPASNRGRLFLAGFLSGMVIALEYPSAIAVGVFAIYGWLTIGDGRLRLAAIAGFLLPVAALAAYQWGLSGHVLFIPYARLEAAMNSYEVHPAGLEVFAHTRIQWKPIALVLFGPTRGLFYLCPWLVFCALGWACMALRPGLTREAAFFAAVSLAMTAFYAVTWTSNALWQAGASLGPRFLLVALPFIVLPLAFLPRPLLAVSFPLMLWSVVTMTASTAVEPSFRQEVYDPLWEVNLPLFANHLYTTSSREIFTLRHWMSDSLSWNLGSLAGLPPAWRLAPLYGAWLIGGWWLIRIASAKTGPRRRGSSPDGAWRARRDPAPPV